MLFFTANIERFLSIFLLSNILDFYLNSSNIGPGSQQFVTPGRKHIMEIIFREDVLALGERYGLGEFARYHQGPTLATTIRRTTRTSVIIALFSILIALFYLMSKNVSHILAYPLSYFLWH